MKRYCLLLAVIAAACRQSDTDIVFPEGGYPYLSSVSSADSNYYTLPVKHLIPRQDSFLYADGYMLYKAFDEPNISLRPLPRPEFRYFTHLNHHLAMIMLTEKEIIVKQGVSGYIYPDDEVERLTADERERYRLLTRYYPLYDRLYEPREQKRIDSMVKAFLRLTDPAYYRYLIDKIKTDNKKSFVYSTRRIALTPARYHHLVDLINNSGYWKAPVTIPCTRPVAMDETNYILEANTPGRYNLVSYSMCCDTSFFHLQQACAELVKYAQN